jgi:hypothetical protein
MLRASQHVACMRSKSCWAILAEISEIKPNLTKLQKIAENDPFFFGIVHCEVEDINTSSTPCLRKGKKDKKIKR